MHTAQIFTEIFMYIYFYTFGCKVNVYETAAMSEAFEKAGYTVTQVRELADILVINSCTVTSESDSKLMQTIRRIRREKPDGVIVLTGCYPQAFPNEAKACGADVITGTKDRSRIVELTEEFLKSRQQTCGITPYMPHDEFEKMPVSAVEGHTRAFMKIQDGCNAFCTYCIIPYSRGRIRSMPLDGVISEAKLLAKNGYKEIVLVGINLAFYGAEFGLRLADAVEAVCSVDGIERVRLGSLEPEKITDDDLKRLAAQPKFCPSFHLSLQSGCDATLRRMRRIYDTAGYRAVVEKLRAAFPGASFTTDIIVGFPGETEEEFAQTLAFLSRCAFSAMHIFPYSRRSGTPAASMPGQCPTAVKQARARQAAQLAGEMRRAWLERWVGRTLSVLFEEEKDGLWRGHAPNYTEVLAPGSGLHNVICDVEITGVREDGLLGRLR